MLHNGIVRDRDSWARMSSGDSQRSEAKDIEGSSRPPSSNSQQSEATEIEDESKSPSTIEQKPIEVFVRTKILSVALLVDEQHFVSGDNDGKIRRWRVCDGEEVGLPMDANSAVRCLVASNDGKWIAAGTERGQVFVWDAETRDKVSEFAYKKGVNSVDISLDGKKIAIASDDNTVDIWSLLGDEWLCGRVDSHFHTVKFSPDGSLFAVGVDSGDSSTSSLSVFYSQNGDRLSSVPVSALSIAWASDSKHLFALSSDGNIHSIDAYSEATLSKWPIHSSDSPRCVSLSSNGTFIAACANTSVSFWDTSTQEQIGYLSHHLYSVNCMAISPNYDLLIAGNSNIALWDLLNILSTPNNQRLATGFQIPESALKYTITKLRSELADAKQKEDTLGETINTLRANLEVQNAKSMDLGKTVKELRIQLSDSRQNANRITQQLNTELTNHKQVIHAYRQKYECQTLYADGHVIDAAKSLLGITKSINDDVEADAIIMDWLSGFTNNCIAALERIGDEASRTRKDDEALAAYAAALFLRPSSSDFLYKWVRTTLLHRPTNQTLNDARGFELPKFAVYRAICDVSEGDGRITEAIKCFRQMQDELAQAPDICNEQVQWGIDFQRRCAESLDNLAEAAFRSQNYDEADRLYSTILSLDSVDRVRTLIKRSHARAMMKSWEDALTDADEVIKLDPSSYRGYESKHAALHGARRHTEAVAAFDTMLLKLQKSSSALFRALRSQYPNARRIIRGIIRATTSHVPRVLIDTTTGQLYDRTQLAEAFEALPVFNELVSSMTRVIDHAWIRREAKEFCRYVMFSHKWEHAEPLFQKVVQVTVYKLEASRGNIKLQTFCSIARSLGFRWAWSDTCCIDKSDNAVLQESLVAMFPWYRGSSLTIIHLLGVSSLSEEPDDLQESIWNSRVWTYQEYVAAQRVLFYTEDWKPYHGLTLENHKESPIVLGQMEMSQVSSEQVAVLQPGLDRVREKLYMASTRETTLVEDIAYSLLGILNAPIPVMYGEGTRAVGRLLEYVLTGSGDATILAWTGTANDYNSCLPVNLTVYKTVIPPHVPHMETAELDRKVSTLRSSILDHSLIAALYEELSKLPSPTLSSSRLRLPGILSCVNDVKMPGPDGQTYRATTDLFGDIEIKTASNLAVMKGLCLVHPWIRPLLDQEFDRGSAGLDVTTEALRLIVRLQQPFGALLFEQVSRTEYKRVAADGLIMAQFREEVSLTDLTSNVRTIEVL